MRDYLLSEAIKRLATEASTKLSTLVAAGEEIPFDVAAEQADDSGFFSYVPLTGRYVEDHVAELRSLPGFGPAREAVAEAGVAAIYLEERGAPVPADPGDRAEVMLVGFLADLWEGGTGFALDHGRLDDALATVDAESRDADDAEVLIVPMVGLRMTAARLQLPRGVRLLRADSIDAPVDAMRSEGMGRAAWEPQYLAVAEQDPDGGAAGALHQLQELASVMRLFKGGGVGLGPYAFAPTGEGTWRRIVTGAPATRPGGYRLSDEEGAELASFAEALESRPDPDAALTWAVGRFEMGCERDSSLDGLSDHLLALRAVLEGHGPVGASLPMRGAALIADGTMDRIEARERLEEALLLERELMNGRSLPNAIELAAWTEEGVRRLLRQAALGELGGDLSATADETLIATGLEGGDAEITVSVGAEEAEEPFSEEPQEELEEIEAESLAPEPRLFDIREAQAEEPEMPLSPDTFAGDEIRVIHETQPSGEFELPDFDAMEPDEEDRVPEQETRIMEPVPAEDEIRITHTPWLDEVSDQRRGDLLEWPVDSDRDIQHRERIDTPRVRHLFPVPDSNWDVSHLEYEHFGKGVS